MFKCLCGQTVRIFEEHTHASHRMSLQLAFQLPITTQRERFYCYMYIVTSITEKKRQHIHAIKINYSLIKLAALLKTKQIKALRRFSKRCQI